MLSGWQVNFLPEGAPPTDPSQQPSADSQIVAGDYFATLGATLIRGRSFNATDTKDSPPVVVIDQTLAEMAFPGQDPLGKRLLLDPQDDASTGEVLYQIIGVVAHMKMPWLRRCRPDSRLLLYQHAGQAHQSRLAR